MIEERCVTWRRQVTKQRGQITAVVTSTMSSYPLLVMSTSRVLDQNSHQSVRAGFAYLHNASCKTCYAWVICITVIQASIHGLSAVKDSEFAPLGITSIGKQIGHHV